MLVYKLGEVSMKEHRTVLKAPHHTWVSIRNHESISDVLNHIDDLLLHNKTGMELLVLTEKDGCAVGLVRRLGVERR